jgi:hypothetical protein
MQIVLNGCSGIELGNSYDVLGFLPKGCHDTDYIGHTILLLLRVECMYVLPTNENFEFLNISQWTPWSYVWNWMKQYSLNLVIILIMLYFICPCMHNTVLSKFNLPLAFGCLATIMKTGSKMANFIFVSEIWGKNQNREWNLEGFKPALATQHYSLFWNVCTLYIWILY